MRTTPRPITLPRSRCACGVINFIAIDWGIVELLDLHKPFLTPMQVSSTMARTSFGLGGQQQLLVRERIIIGKRAKRVRHSQVCSVEICDCVIVCTYVKFAL